MGKHYSGTAALSFGSNELVSPWSKRLRRLARKLWPIKDGPASGGAGRRHASRRRVLVLATDGMSADALAELLRSDAGLHMLEAIVGEARPCGGRPSSPTPRRNAIEKRLAVLRAEIDEARNGLA